MTQTDPHDSRQRPWVSIASALLAIATFAVDLRYPPGLNVPALYIVPLLLSLWQPRSLDTILAAVGCTGLTMMGLLASPEGGSWSSGVVNRIITAFGLWAVAFLVIWFKRAGHRVAHLASIVESSDDAIVAETPEGAVTSWNRAAERIFGYGAEEMIGSSAAALIPPGAAEEEAEIVERLKRGERIEQRETVRIRKDGQKVHVSLTVSPIFGECGTIVGVSRIACDVTDRKRLEEALRRRDQEFRVLADNVPALFSYVDSNRRYRFVNKRYEELFGRTASAILGREVGELLRAENYEKVKPHLDEALRGKPTTFVWELAHRPGLDDGPVRVSGESAPKRWMSVHYMPEVGEQGEIQGIYVLATDVTSAVEAEDALRKSEGRLAALLESAAQGIIAVDGEGRITLVNATAEIMFGYRREELVGRPVEVLIPERHRGVHAEKRRDYFAQPRNRPMGLGLELSGRRKDGSEFPVEISLSHIEAREGPLAVGFIADISERRRAERKERELRAKLLGAQEEERRRIALELHDDLAQKVALLALEVQSLREALPPMIPNPARPLEERIAELSDEIRDISHRLHPSVLDHLGLEAAIRSECDAFAARGQGRARLETKDLPAGIPGDVSICLYRIALEALRNVRKHANAREVSVRLEAGNGGLRLSICDDGVGFNREVSSPGIGLVGMAERAHLIGGELDVRTAPGEGTSVSIWVPLSHE